MQAIDKKEATDNLRVAVKATLLICPQHEYRIWAQKYLQQTEPLIEGLDVISDMATDCIPQLAGWQPWTSLGRARDCWIAIRDICWGIVDYTTGSYNSATRYAEDAVKKCLEVSERSQKLLRGFRESLEVSLYGEAVS